jgi:large subunit ribosomal protein L31
MKPGIHPEYKPTRVTCACGRVSETFATVEELHVEICSHCHPFFTGRQKLVDTAGRVERFHRKYGTAEERSQAGPMPPDAADVTPEVEPGEVEARDVPDEPVAEGTGEAAAESPEDAAEEQVAPELEAAAEPEAEAESAATADAEVDEVDDADDEATRETAATTD